MEWIKAYMRNTVNRDVNIATNNYYDNVVTLNKNNLKILWRKINDIVIEKNHPIYQIIHGISASQLNKYFSTAGKIVSSKLPKQGISKWKKQDPLFCSFTFKDFGVAHVICTALTHLYNISLSFKFIPDESKLVRIIPIYKRSGDVHREMNYRPVSALSNVAKVFEMNVHWLMVNYLEHRVS